MPRIIIVGAGLAGISTLRTLSSKLTKSDGVEVVIFEKSEFYYNMFGVARALTEAEYDKNMFMPYDNLVPAHARDFVRFERAIVTGIAAEPNVVTFQSIGADNKASENGQSMTFDYLILATGSTYNVPIKHDAKNFSRANMEQKIAEAREHIAKSEKILVVGGGAAGCEVAADIAATYPNKKVTLASSSKSLASSAYLREEFSSRVLASLVSLKVDVLLGERLEERLTGNVFEKRTLRTNKGTVIESDVQLLCAGFSPASDLLLGLDPSLVDTKGAIKVNANLQLDDPKYPYIFALGDATNHESMKTGKTAYMQGMHAAALISAQIKYNHSEVKPFPPSSAEFKLPLGPNGGVSQLPVFGGLVLGDWFTWFARSRDMGAGMIWRLLDAAPPS